MSLLLILSVLLVLTAVFGMVNERYLKLQPSMGLMPLALLMSLVLVGIQAAGVTLKSLERDRWTILALAIGSTLIACLVTGALLHLALGWLGVTLGLACAFVFGALISPTDPIAALAILKAAGLPKRSFGDRVASASYASEPRPEAWPFRRGFGIVRVRTRRTSTTGYEFDYTCFLS